MSQEQQQSNQINQTDSDLTEQEQVMRYRQSLLHYTYNSFLAFKREKELEQMEALSRQPNQQKQQTSSTALSVNKDGLRDGLVIV